MVCFGAPRMAYLKKKTKTKTKTSLSTDFRPTRDIFTHEYSDVKEKN